MEISDIISDAIVHPFHNIKALVLFAVLGIIAGLVGGGTVLCIAMSNASGNPYGVGGSAIIGVIILILICLLISGYTIDIIKFGIERRDDSPGIDIARQVSNAVKLVIVDLVYNLIPLIIAGLLLALLGRGILTILIIIIIAIVFNLATVMAKCRLANSDSLGNALAIGEAIGDISKVGIVKILLTTLLILVIVFIVSLLIAGVMNVNDIVGGILFGIFYVYLLFFYNRSIGLLYSDA